MIKSLEEDHDAGYISDEKYKELFNRYQKVLRQLNKEEADNEIKTEDKKVNKPISNHEPSIEKSSSNINVNNINNQKKEGNKKVNNDYYNCMFFDFKNDEQSKSYYDLYLDTCSNENQYKLALVKDIVVLTNSQESIDSLSLEFK